MTADPLELLATFSREQQNACEFAAEHAAGWWPATRDLPCDAWAAHSRAASEWWQAQTDSQKRDWLYAAREVDAANGKHLGLVYRLPDHYAQGIPEGHAFAVIHHDGGFYNGGTDEYVDLGVQPSICHALAAALMLPDVQADGAASIWDERQEPTP